MTGEHVAHGPGRIAYHVAWELRNEAAIWRAGAACEPNLYPYGRELRRWLQNEPAFLPVVEVPQSDGRNPYTGPASVLVAAFQMITAETAKERTAASDLEEELLRVRLFGEFVLHVSRIGEALIKQMLYCTNFPEGMYRRAPLGALLSQECGGCRASNSRRHRLSLLGSLAHRYGLCGPYDACIEKLLPHLKGLRDTQTAHAGVGAFKFRKPGEALQLLRTQVEAAGKQFVHLLEHIGDLEVRITEEIQGEIKKAREAT